MLKAVIFAGGLGTRLGTETDMKPKPMVEIGGMPIIWHIMKIYSSYGIDEFIICLGHKGVAIRDFFIDYMKNSCDVTIDISRNEIEYHSKCDVSWRVTLVDTGEGAMTGGRLKAVRHHLDRDRPFFLTYGDGLAGVDIAAQLAFHRSHRRQVTVTAVRPPPRFGSLEIGQDLVRKFHEKDRGSEGLISGGFFVCEPGVVDLIDGPQTVWEREPLERLAADGELVAYRHEGFWHPMDTMSDKQYLERLWQEGAPWKVW